MPDPNNTVIRERKLVFMMIAKSGNTSVMRALRDACHLHGRADHHFPNVSKAVVAADFRSYLKITFVRNPFDRLVSCYEDKVQRNYLGALKNFGIIKGMPFDEFVDVVCATQDEKCTTVAQHFRSQTFDLMFNGSMLPNLIGRMETFDDDWSRMRGKVRDWCGLDLGGVRRENAMPERPHYREYFDEKQRARVERRFTEDLKVLRYSF